MRSIEMLKKHLVKETSFFLVRFFWRSKKNEQKKLFHALLFEDNKTIYHAFMHYY